MTATLPAQTSKKASVPSISSLVNSQGLRGNHVHASSTIKTVITSPPWARDEPPSPTEQACDIESANPRPSESRPSASDVISYQSSSGSNMGTRWWTFNIPRPRDHSSLAEAPASPKEKKGLSLRDRSMSWMPSSHHRSQDGTTLSPSFSRREKDRDPPLPTSEVNSDGWGIHVKIPIPPVPDPPFTVAQNKTPGWDSPWTPRLGAGETSNARRNYSNLEDANGPGHDDDDSNKNLSPWQRKRKRFRTFMLTHTYIPLLFRFINITFTTAALALAIRIRLYELRWHIMGAVGSSPTLVIIFAPLTLVHVMAAIYLEYFGRPLGLWSTSGKLAHTLSEVLFICAWSAALSLCFDNFFTSVVPCASPGSTSWYNQLPRPSSPVPDLGRNEGGVGDRICDDQLVLICLVGVGLIMYCTNLVISLFRIFEKVKYHPVTMIRS